MMDGLKDAHREAIITAIAANDRVERAVLFGSRATGANTETSDVDIALFGHRLTLTDQARLAAAVEEIPMAQSVDLILYDNVGDPTLRAHIRNEGVNWFERPGIKRDWLYHPVFPQHWRSQPLYSMATWVNGLAFKRIQFSETGKPVIKIAEIKGGISGQTRFTQQTFDDSVFVRPGDLLFSWSGQPETSIDAFWWRGPEGWLNQHVFRVTPEVGLDVTFFYYLLRYLKPNFVGIARNKQTTGLGHVTKRDLENLEVASPDWVEQRAIAHILGTLDDKIELNRRMNETLEAMAKVLFKSWFVDFDPVRAKMEGRDTGLPDDIAELFPDRLMDSEIGEIPEGWQVASLGDVAALRRKGTDPASEAKDTPYIGLADMPRGSIALTDWGEIGSVSSRKSAFSAGDILFGKLRPYFHKVGIAPVAGFCSTDIVVLSARKPKWSPFVLACVSSSAFVAHTSQTATGTKMPRTSWRAMSGYELCRPTDAIASEFQRIVSPMLGRIVGNIHESRSLGALRDILLPKFISGEIRVPITDQGPAAVTDAPDPRTRGEVVASIRPRTAWAR